MPRQFSEKEIIDRRAARLRWYYRNRERARKKHAEWLAANKSQQETYNKTYDEKHRQERKLKAARRRQESPRKTQEISRRSHAKHRAKYRALNRAWKAANPDACVTHTTARRARKQEATGSHTTVEWRSILKAHGYRCTYCGTKQSLTVRLTRDHYIPLSKGGSNFASNIVPACRPCNGAKHARDPIEFAHSRGKLF